MNPSLIQSAASQPAQKPAEAKTKRPAGMAGVVHDVQQALDDQNAVVSERERSRQLMASLKPSYEQAVRPVGRPALYTEDMPRIVYDLFTRFDAVLTKKAIAAHLGVDESTMRRWKEEYPELKAAITQGMAIQETFLTSKMADGIKYSQSLFAVLGNLHGWSSKVENSHKLGIDEALRLQAAGAKRVDWDRSRPDPLAQQKAALNTREAITVLPPPSTAIPIVPHAFASPARHATTSEAQY